MKSTTSERYTEHLIEQTSTWWKRVLPVQLVYALKLRSLKLGYTLDLGCGIGRNLRNLKGQAVGVDHNLASIEVCRKSGFSAFNVDEFSALFANKSPFDSILLSHIVEHMTFQEAVGLLQKYLPYLKPSGKVVIIAPQAAGFKSDLTHVEYFDMEKLMKLLEAAHVQVNRRFSFPFPEVFGLVFKYNEHCIIGTKLDQPL